MKWDFKTLIFSFFLSSLFLTLALIEPKVLWDLDFFHAISRMVSAGVSPYDASRLHEFWSGDQSFRFVYPPLSAWGLGKLSFLSLEQFKILFLILKCFAATALILIWQTTLFTNQYRIFSWLYLLLGFHGAFWIDFRAGNVSTFEQFFLWSGVLLPLGAASKAGMFLLAFSQKWVLIPFLFIRSMLSRNVKLMMWGSAFLIGYLMLQMIFFSHELALYVQGIQSLEEARMVIGPSTLVAVRGLMKMMGVLFHQTRMDEWIYAGLVFFILGVSIRHFLRNPISDTTLKFMYWIWVYALCVPRMKDYSLILLVPAAWYLFQRTRGKLKGAALFVLLLSLTQSYGLWVSMFLGWVVSCALLRVEAKIESA